MVKRRGVVMKAGNKKAIVLTPDAEFLEVETNGKKYDVGQEIYFETVTETKAVINWKRVTAYAIIPAAIALLLIIPSYAKGLITENRTETAVKTESTNTAKITKKTDKQNRTEETNEVENVNKPEGATHAKEVNGGTETAKIEEKKEEDVKKPEKKKKRVNNVNSGDMKKNDVNNEEEKPADLLEEDLLDVLYVASKITLN